MQKERTLVLGAGWVGGRLADVCCAEKTHRASTSGGVEFRIEDSSSWSNLPLAGEDLAVVITFSLDVAPFEQLQKFWNEYLSKVCCIIAYSTTSVYEVAAPEAVVDESSPLTGKDLRGQSLENRIRAEEFLREKGAIILTLSGIFGEDRRVDSLVKKGYIKNGNKLVNLIHVADIIAITKLLLDKRHDKTFHHQRYNVSSGAYRWSALCEHYGCDPLPTAPTDTTSKVVSNEKLLKTVLSEGYAFRRADQEPVEDAVHRL